MRPAPRRGELAGSATLSAALRADTAALQPARSTLSVRRRPALCAGADRGGNDRRLVVLVAIYLPTVGVEQERAVAAVTPDGLVQHLHRALGVSHAALAAADRERLVGAPSWYRWGPPAHRRSRPRPAIQTDRPWGDCNLYLRRHRDELTLTVEHRAAPAPDPIPLTLTSDGDALALAVADRTAPSSPTSLSLDDRITGALADAAAALSVAQLRPLWLVRNATLYRCLAALCSQGILVRSTAGYRLADSSTANASRSLVPSRPPGYGTRELHQTACTQTHL